jgi:Co/Zn/Cd efflux system component
VADSLDMLADASVYALSLVAVGGSVSRKRRVARGSGYLQLALAVGGLIEVTRRFASSNALPDVTTMIVVASLALAANAVTLLVLRKARSPEAHFQASWIFTANDIKVNALVIASAIVVAAVDHPAPDLIAGALIFLIVANGARRILTLAR